MSDLNTIQDAYENYRSQTAETYLQLQRARAAFDRLVADEERELKSLDKDKRKQRKEFYAREKQRLSDQLEQLTTSGKDSKKVFEDLSAAFLKQLNPIEEIAKLDNAFPVLMFPLRLETRFKSTGDTPQLWLRVYPDDCNINTKEDVLSESELKTATSFWIEIWKAGGIETEERGAWRSFVNSHGSGRCAWIIQQFKPNNNKPTKTGADKKILVVISALLLSDDEHKAAKDYWTAYWLAKGDATSIATAFNTLKAETSDARADEIKQNYVPVNLDDPVPHGMVPTKVALEKLDLPAYTAKQTSWTQAAKTLLLPDKFVAIVYHGSNKRTVLFPKSVKDQLSVSIDPSLTGDEQVKKDDKGNLVLNKDVKWMADFEEAVEVGMAVKIDLSAQEAANGFEKLFVIGIRFRSGTDESRVQLEQLLADHFYSKYGFGLLKQGTPTNNTEEIPAGYSWTDDPDQSYESIFLHRNDFSETPELDKKSDGQKLADYLGIDPAVLKNVPNANGKDQLGANAMNTALFPATLGYFMDEMMDPLFSERDIEATKIFFSNFVSGRGPIPAIRIGRQPYGILPVSVYSKLNFGRIVDTGGNRPNTYLARLHALLQKMDATWDSLLSEVSFIGKTGDAHQILLDVIGLHPNSVEFHQRYSQTILQLYNQLALQTGPVFAALIAAAIAERGKVILRDLGIAADIKLPILEKFFLSKPNLLGGPLVDDVPDSEINQIRTYSTDGLNYIQWLSSSTPEKIRAENFGGNPAPTALLYLLLRHSLMLAQADAATAFLVTNNVISDKKAFHDPDLLYVQKEDTGKSKFEHLYNTYPVITGSSTMKLADHIYKPDVLQSTAETKKLNDTINALRVLENMPTAALERLLTEHIDCCNYRIDAWKTGLVNYRLTEQRTMGQQGGQFSKGIYLGAYGLLLDVRPGNKVLTDFDLSPELTEIFNEGNKQPLQTDSSNLGYIHAPSLNQAATAAILRNAYDSNRSTGSGNPFAINLTSDRVRIADKFLEGMRNGQSLSALLGYQFERGLHDKYSLGQGEVDMFIYPLRKAFPLVADHLVSTKTDSSASIEAIEAKNVIDGLKLINHVLQASVKTYPYGLTGLPAASADQAQAINDEVGRITDIQDAIADLIISEQVYQVVQGNFERASGNAEAFSKGSYPPDVDIISTPRSGVTLTHRMAIQFDAGADPVLSPNSIAAMTPRSTVEPSVNKWLSDHLPDPEKVLCKVTYSSPVQAETEVEVSQKNLGLQSIDLLYVFSLDTEQAMTELDDRITQYIRYTVSQHPKTDISINYTKSVDGANRSKVSFFELSALIKSLRKVISGSKYISPSAVTVPQEGMMETFDLDHGQLKSRITTLRNGLVPLKTSIETILTNTKSIRSLSDLFKTQLQVPITDVSKTESILTQLRQDLKDYLLNPIAATKVPILTAFESSLESITDAGVKTTLKTTYSNILESYVADFSNFDQLAAETITSLMKVAMFDNNQTGTGFIHQGIISVYDSVFSKLGNLVERWEKKKTDAETILGQYDSATTDEERVEVLRSVEKIISSTLTLPLRVPMSDYKSDVEAQKGLFDALLNNLKSLPTNTRQKITDFVSDAETYTVNIGNYDVIPFDVDRKKNDLAAEKLLLAILKEDIVTALVNLKNAVANKITSCDTLVSEADATVLNAGKITALLNAAKTILGEEALVLPQFSLALSQGTELENSYNDRDAILDFVKTNEKRILPVDDWLGGMARVREKVHEWENICFLSNAFRPGSWLDLAPIQLPFREDDRWFAVKFRDETDPQDEFSVQSDTLLYTVHFAGGFDKTKPQCGVVIDEWTEVIPASTETTGITFHYDQPNSEPPQTMLLVTPPQITGEWNWNDIVEAIEETLEMAKKRAVESTQIEATSYAQFLPSIMMAVTSYGITVATNLSINNYFANRTNDNSV
jgi:hypothetical protein